MKPQSVPRMLMMSCLIAGAMLTTVSEKAHAIAPVQASCQLGHGIQRVVYIVFDNVHLHRDDPNVPSDLEQMPNLLNFLKNNGVVSGNHHTPLISHTAHDIVTGLTGVYGARSGIPVANSYGYFKPDGTVGFQSSFLYWTANSADGQKEMINELGKNAPAPWVPFTRAGCDVGAFSVANIDFESVPGDVDTVFGAGSPESVIAHGPPDLAGTDFLGIVIHCAQNSPLCANGAGAADLLPDEPGGYTGYLGLFGHYHVKPAILPGPSQILDLDGNVIADAYGNPGFPGWSTPFFHRFDPTATQSLGYAAQMLEAGVPVVYLYAADAHDRNPSSPPGSTNAYGPGEDGYVLQLQAYDTAFGKFFARLAADGITPANTLFVVTADENDHFVGGTPTPPKCNGVHVPCSWVGQIGEVNAQLDRLLASQPTPNTTPFSVHSDSAPTVYIPGTAGGLPPSQTDPLTRGLELSLSQLTVTNPFTGTTGNIAVYLADQAAMNLLHMITSVPDRSPTFTMFGDPNYFSTTAGNTNSCASPPSCVFIGSSFAWNHGDVQQDITRTWAGMAGPGILHLGRHDGVFSDHTDLRPTILALLGLTDDYVNDGRALIEFSSLNLIANSGDRTRYLELAKVFKQINAPLGALGLATLGYSNKSVIGTNATYANYLTKMLDITSRRNDLASQMLGLMNGAVFSGQSIDPAQTRHLVSQGNELINEVQTCAAPGCP